MECRWGTETKRRLLEDKTVFLVYMPLEGAQTSALITDLIALFTPGWAMPGPSGRSPISVPRVVSASPWGGPRPHVASCHLLLTEYRSLCPGGLGQGRVWAPSSDQVPLATLEL